MDYNSAARVISHLTTVDSEDEARRLLDTVARHHGTRATLLRIAEARRIYAGDRVAVARLDMAADIVNGS